MKKIDQKCKMHVLVCVNERDKSADMPCCAHVHGQEIYDAIKKYVREHGLVGIVWVTRTKCLGFCNSVGATVVLYPQKLWFTEVLIEDVPKLKEMITEYI